MAKDIRSVQNAYANAKLGPVIKAQASTMGCMKKRRGRGSTSATVKKGFKKSREHGFAMDQAKSPGQKARWTNSIRQLFLLI